MARKEPEISGLAGWTLVGLRKPATVSTYGSARFAQAHDPEHIAMHIVSGAIRLAKRCLEGNCLTRPLRLDSHN